MAKNVQVETNTHTQTLGSDLDLENDPSTGSARAESLGACSHSMCGFTARPLSSAD